MVVAQWCVWDTRQNVCKGLSPGLEQDSHLIDPALEDDQLKPSWLKRSPLSQADRKDLGWRPSHLYL